MAWQPIETAPKDGEMVLLWTREKEIVKAYWVSDRRYVAGGRWQDCDREMLVHPDATRWMRPDTPTETP